MVNVAYSVYNPISEDIWSSRAAEKVTTIRVSFKIEDIRPYIKAKLQSKYFSLLKELTQKRIGQERAE